MSQHRTHVSDIVESVLTGSAAKGVADPLELPGLPGYEVEMFYRPFREVGGDYFDVLQLPNNRTLFAVADVSGKGMSADLLAANIQDLVRSIASVEANPLAKPWFGRLTST